MDSAASRRSAWVDKSSPRNTSTLLEAKTSPSDCWPISAGRVNFRDFDLQSDAAAAKMLQTLGHSPTERANYLERTMKDDGLPGWHAFRGDSIEYLPMRESLAQ